MTDKCFIERLHGYVLELLGIYDWQMLGRGAITMSDASIEKLQNATPEEVCDRVKDKTFINDILEHFRYNEDEFDGDFDCPVYKMFIKEADVTGNPWSIAGGDAAYSFFRYFAKPIMEDAQITDKTCEIILTGDDYSDVLKSLKRQYRGKANKPYLLEKLFNEYEEDIFVQFCYDYGIQPKSFSLSDYALDEDGDLELKFKVDRWITSKEREIFKRCVLLVGVELLMQEMTVER